MRLLNLLVYDLRYAKSCPSFSLRVASSSHDESYLEKMWLVLRFTGNSGLIIKIDDEPSGVEWCIYLH